MAGDAQIIRLVITLILGIGASIALVHLGAVKFLKLLPQLATLGVALIAIGWATGLAFGNALHDVIFLRGVYSLAAVRTFGVSAFLIFGYAIIFALAISSLIHGLATLAKRSHR